MKSKCVRNHSGDTATANTPNTTTTTSSTGTNKPEEETTAGPTHPKHLQNPSSWLHSVNINRLEELLKGNKGRIDSMDERGHTLLHLAILANRIEIVQLLINLGANVTLANRDGWSPLHIAAYSGNSDIISFLLQNKL